MVSWSRKRPGKGVGVAGQGSGAVAIVADPGGDRAAVAALQIGQDGPADAVVASGAGGLGVAVGVGEQVGHRRGPDLAGGVGGVEGA